MVRSVLFMVKEFGGLAKMFNDKGFRVATCIVCKQQVEITSYPDDTRWHYSKHYDNNELNQLCLVSEMLVPKEEKDGRIIKSTSH